MRERRRSERGYTIVELMMALAIFMVAAVGIFSMQKVAANTNAHAKNLAIAQHIAQATAGQLEMDGTQWKGVLAGDWLPNIPYTDGQWHLMAPSNVRRFGSAFDGLGVPVFNLADARFCTNVRLSPLFVPGAGRAGNGVLRAEIRVYWVRDNATPLAPFCAEQPADLLLLGQRPDLYQFVYQTIGVRQHL